ncbi:PE_PGRS protein, putative [Trichomonas vaginalis G3]|uniref:receptor protein-tyrosine kinase n=1 Tax=Trichomonas vaginalis (strain ATCC PRA-98 / G3) TaxID=412133 RepID=A2G356_TRIV3|nr:glycine-rich protein family [Trichomonas vaginalis G3]EAX88414.1 PE_PGRS protein, putative [Trichomonas vaginalis G3]KAI5504648.1 glycine-rich protein family [Trichomonas vaginalis G3]|eukprot:XP_001301344.1 PE_PGRS protein [Trichomonas vaginalis G3]
MISYRLYNESVPGAVKKVTINENQYLFEYPCESHYICTDYQIILSRGKYMFELYGASGGSLNNKTSSYRFENNSCIDDSIVRRYNGNTQCEKIGSNGGAGGYISGTIILHSDTITFLTIGGKGIFSYNIEEKNTDRCFSEYRNRGGYGGGGSSANYFYSQQIKGTGSGGGQTTVKFLKNDLWYRVLVSGGGGGTDDASGGNNGMVDDGSGGAGGNIIAQSWFLNGKLQKTYFANSTNGFTFGTGEAARFDPKKNPNSVTNGDKFDNAGAGAGWFGGFASQSQQGGAGGGSSWALSRDAIIPEGDIEATDEFYDNAESHPYGFTKTSGYLFTDVEHAAGIWNGHGRIIITYISSLKCPSFIYSLPLNINILIFIILLDQNSS